MARVLIVEDNPDLLHVLSELLSGEHDVQTAPAGEEGVAVARGFRPDVVLMDLQLPRMDGMEAARRIKDERAPDAVSVVILTALAHEVDRARILDSGCCDAFLAKPAPLARIREMVRDLAPASRHDRE